MSSLRSRHTSCSDTAAWLGGQARLLRNGAASARPKEGALTVTSVLASTCRRNYLILNIKLERFIRVLCFC